MLSPAAAPESLYRSGMPHIGGMPADLAVDDIQAQLDRMLASATFVKAWRDSRLLRYLVAAATTASRLVNEYAIGIDVFGRKPADYSPGEDPIVRVQLGRLRHRLDAYYLGAGRFDPVRFTLPLRSYALHFERNAGRAPFALRLAIHASATGRRDAAHGFTEGLHEELQHRLHHQLGAQFASAPRRDDRDVMKDVPQDCHVLECGVRTDGIDTRTTLRLLAPAHERILWSRQVDHGMDLSIACQERLAALCCTAVREWMRGLPPSGAPDGAAQ